MVWPSARSVSTSSRSSCESVGEGLQLGDLAADMHVDAGHLNAGQGRGIGIDSAGALIGDAELVFLLAGRNLGVGLGVDIRVDAEGDMRLLAFAHGAGIQHFQFRFGFDVEAIDAGIDRQVHFGGRLADAGKHDAAGRNAGRQRPAQFTPETTSTPAPRRPSVFSTAWFEFAFIA